MTSKTVAVIGGDPVGLAAAAHLMERGMTPIVLEAGERTGHAVRQWRHVQLFSPWKYNIDGAAARLLASTGWNPPIRKSILRAASCSTTISIPLGPRRR
jgi:NADPH-dependent 2,4-dienoyl-CoA reductase/sulfur reductase-like enzyme